MRLTLFLIYGCKFWLNATDFNLISLLPLALSLYSLSAVIIKRLHDRNRSGKAVIMAFVPVVCYGVSLSAQDTIQWLLGIMMPMFIGTMLLLEWGVFRGNPQANQYGEKGLSIKLR
ncbi:Predicted membrane protein [Actinobacillus pleuropneumoniae]|nr:Predicted membrane protein [Actinobacillus pleuropneumoniae]